MIDFVGEFQTHATDKAVLGSLVALGLFQCFFGVRFFRQSLAISAFCAAFILGSSIATHHVEKDEYAYAAGAAAGLVAAMIAGCSVKTGVLLLCTCAGVASSYVAYLTILHYTTVKHSDVVFYASVALAGILGALIGLHMSRWIVIFGTAIGGSLVAVRSVDLLWDNVLTKDAVESGNLPREGWELVATFAALALIGIAFQAAGGHTLDDEKKRREREALLNLPTYANYNSAGNGRNVAPQYD